MPLAAHPFFRKAIVPWYDSDTACTVVIVLMIPVMLFGVLGIYVAQSQAAYREHFWVPMLLVALTAGVIFSTAARMIRRR